MHRPKKITKATQLAFAAWCAKDNGTGGGAGIRGGVAVFMAVDIAHSFTSGFWFIQSSSILAAHYPEKET